MYRLSELKSEFNDIIEWRIYDEYKNLLEIGVVSPTVKGKEVSWFVGV